VKDIIFSYTVIHRNSKTRKIDLSILTAADDLINLSIHQEVHDDTGTLLDTDTVNLTFSGIIAQNPSTPGIPSTPGNHPHSSNNPSTPGIHPHSSNNPTTPGIPAHSPDYQTSLILRPPSRLFTIKWITGLYFP